MFKCLNSFAFNFELPFILVAPFRRVRAAQLLLVFVVVVSPIGRRDMTKRQTVRLAVIIFLRDSGPAATMVVRRRVTTTVRHPVLLFRGGRPSGRQGRAGRKRFWA